MPLQPSSGLFEIKFVSALAICSLVVAVGVAPLATESLTEHLTSMRATASLTAESQGREPQPNVKDNLQSELKFNQQNSKNPDRLASDLYYDPEIDTYSKEQNTDFREFDRATESESSLTSAIMLRNEQDRPSTTDRVDDGVGASASPEKPIENSAISQTATTLAQLPNRGEDRREIPVW